MPVDTPLPIRFCPRCASEKFARTPLKFWFCSRCEFTFYQNTAAAVAGVLMCGAEILMTVRKGDPGQGLLDLPGGFVDPQESLEAALTREILEELRLSYHGWVYLFSFPNRYAYKDIAYDTADAFFKADFDVRPHLVPGDDVGDIVWVRLADVDLSRVAFSSMRRAIGRLQQME